MSAAVSDESSADKSQWVPLAWMDERYKYLKDKGLAYYNGKKILPGRRAKFPVDRLHEDEIALCDRNTVLNDEQSYAGNSFRTLCDCAAGRSSGRDARDGEPAQRDAVLHKIAIEQQLAPAQKHIVRSIVIYSQVNPLIEENYKVIRERITLHVRNAFDALIEAMKTENIQKVLDARHEKR